MQILPQPLSSNEKELFNEIIDLIIQSNTTNGEKGHHEFDHLLEDYGDEFDINMTDIRFELVENIILMEEIREDHNRIVEMSKIELLMVKFALTAIIDQDKFPEDRETFIIKVDNLLKLKDHEQNQN